MRAVGGITSLSKLSEQWFYDKLSDKEQAIVTAFTGYNSTRDPSKESDTKILEQALNKFQLTKPIVAYRGVSVEEFTDIIFSDTQTTTEMKSTSTKLSTAENFALNQGGYIVEYRIKPGRKGAYLDGGVPMSVENEFVLNRGLKYNIISKPSKNRLIVEI